MRSSSFVEQDCLFQILEIRIPERSRSTEAVIFTWAERAALTDDAGGFRGAVGDPADIEYLRDRLQVSPGLIGYGTRTTVAVAGFAYLLNDFVSINPLSLQRRREINAGT